jgi:hypothetical protein
MICRNHSFQKVTQGNNVVFAPTSNTDGFLSRYACVSSTHQNRPICNKMRLSPLWKVWYAAVFLPKTNTFLTGKECALAPASNKGGFLSSNACVSSAYMKRPIWNTMSLSPAWTLWLPGCIPFKNCLNSQRETMLEASASKIDGFLCRDTCVSSTHLNRPIERKEHLSPPWNTSVAGRISFKN